MALADDPYFSGHAVKKAAGGEPLGGRAGFMLAAWTAVFLVNLIVPLQFAWSITRQSGRIGMYLGILCFFGAGCLVGLKSRRALMTVMYGGWVVAASQFYPFLQMIAGMIGVTAAGAVGQTIKPGIEGDLNGETGGFIATVMTGGILLVAALFFGLVIRGMIVMGAGKSADRAKPFG